MVIEVISLDKKIREAVREPPRIYLPRFRRVRDIAKRALKDRKTIVWIEGPLGCGKSTLAEILADLLELNCSLENPDAPEIQRYLRMLYSADKEVRKIGAVGVNNAYFPHRMEQYERALRSASSFVLDRIAYADDIYMEGFIEDGLMTREQVNDIGRRRKTEMGMLKPRGITAPAQIVIQITGKPVTFYRRKNERGRDVEMESGGAGVPLPYMRRLTTMYESLPQRLGSTGFEGQILQVKQELGNDGEFDPANQKHLTPILEAITRYVT